MTALARDLKVKSIPAEEIFRERCEARAILYETAEISLHEAVDVLQEDAERTGLIDMVGQDAVQSILAESFAKLPRAGELEAAISELADALEAPRPRSGVAPSTLMAAEYLIRMNDPKRLRAWLASHSAVERIAIKKHLRAKNGKMG